jgi:hypothetical protein
MHQAALETSHGAESGGSVRALRESSAIHTLVVQLLNTKRNMRIAIDDDVVAMA